MVKFDWKRCTITHCTYIHIQCPPHKEMRSENHGNYGKISTFRNSWLVRIEEMCSLGVITFISSFKHDQIVFLTPGIIEVRDEWQQ